MLAVAAALAIQALFFGDGGVLALGANVFNMAVAMPLAAHLVYRLALGRSGSSRGQVVAAAAAGYVAMNVAALLTAVQFGIQPLLFRAADGAPLYAPYGLEVAIPVMMLGHLAIAGPAEALVTALAVAYLLRTNPGLLRAAGDGAEPAHRPRLRWLWAGIGLLVVLVPIGLLTAATAWGEWDPSNPDDWPLPFVPEGLRALSGLWSAPVPDYALSVPGAGAWTEALGYVASAALGVALLAFVGIVVGRLAGGGRGGRDEQRAASH
jgi:cobalt/nickel transport system permease protein